MEAAATSQYQFQIGAKYTRPITGILKNFSRMFTCKWRIQKYAVTVRTWPLSEVRILLLQNCRWTPHWWRQWKRGRQFEETYACSPAAKPTLLTIASESAVLTPLPSANGSDAQGVGEIFTPTSREVEEQRRTKSLWKLFAGLRIVPTDWPRTFSKLLVPKPSWSKGECRCVPYERLNYQKKERISFLGKWEIPMNLVGQK